MIIKMIKKLKYKKTYWFAAITGLPDNDIICSPAFAYLNRANGVSTWPLGVTGAIIPRSALIALIRVIGVRNFDLDEWLLVLVFAGVFIFEDSKILDELIKSDWFLLISGVWDVK